MGLFRRHFKVQVVTAFDCLRALVGDVVTQWRLSLFQTMTSSSCIPQLRHLQEDVFSSESLNLGAFYFTVGFVEHTRDQRNRFLDQACWGCCVYSIQKHNNVKMFLSKK